jgi:hypothetical protein
MIETSHSKARFTLEKKGYSDIYEQVLNVQTARTETEMRAQEMADDFVEFLQIPMGKEISIGKGEDNEGNQPDVRFGSELEYLSRGKSIVFSVSENGHACEVKNNGRNSLRVKKVSSLEKIRVGTGEALSLDEFDEIFFDKLRMKIRMVGRQCYLCLNM